MRRSYSALIDAFEDTQLVIIGWTGKALGSMESDLVGKRGKKGKKHRKGKKDGRV